MKLLITSDVHSDLDALREVIEQHKDITHHINAGDMCLEPILYERYHIISVKGNNDFGYHLPLERLINIEGQKILLTHGHYERVKSNLERLKLKAKSLKVNICIFGHTHERYHQVEDGICFINPGALGDHHRSYAIYENEQVTFYQRNIKWNT